MNLIRIRHADVHAPEPCGTHDLLLGQAGNREDGEIRALATVVAADCPDRIGLKDLPGYLHGRGDGEVPAILHGELVRRGVAEACIAIELNEWSAALGLLAWARRHGDTLVLPVHGKQTRTGIGVARTTVRQRLARG